MLVKGEDVTRLPASARTRRGLGRAFQLTNLFPNLTVFENVRLAVQARARAGSSLLSLWERPARPDGGRRHHPRARASRATSARRVAGALPHGDQRKLEVALLIALEPDVFMFDEPTAGMSVDEVPNMLEIIGELKRDAATRPSCSSSTRWTWCARSPSASSCLHNGALVADGLPAEVMASAIVREAYLGQELGDE